MEIGLDSLLKVHIMNVHSLNKVVSFYHAHRKIK